MKTYQLYINGEYIAATSKATIDVIDPSDNLQASIGAGGRFSITPEVTYLLLR